MDLRKAKQHVLPIFWWITVIFISCATGSTNSVHPTYPINALTEQQHIPGSESVFSESPIMTLVVPLHTSNNKSQSKLNRKRARVGANVLRTEPDGIGNSSRASGNNGQAKVSLLSKHTSPSRYRKSASKLSNNNMYIYRSIISYFKIPTDQRNTNRILKPNPLFLELSRN